MTTTWVVIACCRAKLDRPAAARDLYTGSTFRSALAAAESGHFGPDARVLVMSAKHGLVDPAAVLDPYDVTIDDPAAITAEAIVGQAAVTFDITPDAAVHTLLPRAYRDRLRVGVPWVVRWHDEYAGCRGIGDQRARLRAIRDGVSS